MAQYSNRIFVCPFFTSANKGDRINCEGGRVMMPNSSLTGNYSRKYCESEHWNKCTMARDLLRYYEEDSTDRPSDS